MTDMKKQGKPSFRDKMNAMNAAMNAATSHDLDELKQLKADAKEARAGGGQANASPNPPPAEAGNLAQTGVFGGQTVEIYDGGYVRVGMYITPNLPYEKLRSIKFSHQVQDKSAGGRALASGMSFGLSKLASNEKRVLFLTVATDKKVHTLKTTGGMTRADDQAGMRLEAAGQAILDALGAGAAAAPVVVHVTAPDTPPAAADPLEQLKKLGELRDAGILTEEEFTAKKADILGRM